MPLDVATGLDVELLIPGMTCAGCMRKVERALSGGPGVLAARANLSQHRARVRYDPDQTDVEALIARLGPVETNANVRLAVRKALQALAGGIDRGYDVKEWRRVFETGSQG